jgi:hypothetical protein
MTKIIPRTVVTLVAIALLATLAACDDDSATATGPTGSISGTVTFRNAWPATGAMFVTVFSAYPPTGAPDAFTEEITEAKLGPGRTYDFKISGLETGTYHAVLVGWRGGVGNDKCTGLYWSFPDSVGINSDCIAQAPGPSAVTVKKNQTTANVDMVSDLNLAQ